MVTILYRAGWSLARALAPLAGSGKLGRAVRGRRDGARAIAAWAALHRDTKRPLVWFHAASVGEGRQAEAVIARLRAARPTWQIILTHSSASAETFVRTLPADFAGYVPADTPGDTGRALDALRPSAIVFSATDLWPELVHAAKQRGVASGMISATLAPTSSRRGSWARSLLTDAYAGLDRVGAIAPEDANGLQALGVRATAITVTGDTRHDAAAARAGAIDRSSPAVRALLAADVPLLVAGSTWPSDEQVLLPALARVREGLKLGLVIAPHEPTPSHLASLEGRLAAVLGNAAIVRLTHLEAAFSAPRSPGPPSSWDVCLVDRVGVLAELYVAARIAFVGGGFHRAGLHSVIEPAAVGVPVMFGPQWRSSHDAELLLREGGAAVAKDSGEIAAALRRWLDDDGAHRSAGDAARAVVDRGLGAADRSLELVLGLVGSGIVG